MGLITLFFPSCATLPVFYFLSYPPRGFRCVQSLGSWTRRKEKQNTRRNQSSLLRKVPRNYHATLTLSSSWPKRSPLVIPDCSGGGKCGLHPGWPLPHKRGRSDFDLSLSRDSICSWDLGQCPHGNKLIMMFFSWTYNCLKYPINVFPFYWYS